ncbi:MAG: carboxylating nicotinate-nucleotide diphosphorylase [Candidatus Lokiarchaeota archaeon]|nr:carboxylating nicotinate-nucleotide diphosphorylase [Candidatus Lokiarchaeota archaeon]
MNLNKLLIEKKLKQFLEEDCHFKDVSSEFIPTDSKVKAKIIAKSSGYISGLEVVSTLFKMLKVKVNLLKEEGEQFNEGDILVRLEGSTRKILLGERISLNLLTLMSSITTTTREFVKLSEKYDGKTRIACTRKTTPGLRLFEKRAVELGGGDTHRYSLDDMILLKDTHLRYYKGNIEKLLTIVKEKASFSKKIEIEIENVDDIVIAAQKGADIIMCDNMTPQQVEESIQRLKNAHLQENIKPLIEVSGGITLDNIEEYLKVGPDIISTSELTLYPTNKVDLSLRFE